MLSMLNICFCRSWTCLPCHAAWSFIPVLFPCLKRITPHKADPESTARLKVLDCLCCPGEMNARITWHFRASTISPRGIRCVCFPVSLYVVCLSCQPYCAYHPWELPCTLNTKRCIFRAKAFGFPGKECSKSWFVWIGCVAWTCCVLLNKTLFVQLSLGSGRWCVTAKVGVLGRPVTSMKMFINQCKLSVVTIYYK